MQRCQYCKAEKQKSCVMYTTYKLHYNKENQTKTETSLRHTSEL